MPIAYVKKLIVNGEGKFNVVKLEAETEEGINLKRDEYLANDYQDCPEEDYTAQIEAVEPTVEPVESTETPVEEAQS
jgi:hypothetical protein